MQAVALLTFAFVLSCEAANISCQTGHEAVVGFQSGSFRIDECGSNQICIKGEAMLNYSLTVFGSLFQKVGRIVLASCANSSTCASLTCRDVFRNSKTAANLPVELSNASISSASRCNITCCDWDVCNTPNPAVIASEKAKRASTAVSTTGVTTSQTPGNMGASSSSPTSATTTTPAVLSSDPGTSHALSTTSAAATVSSTSTRKGPSTTSGAPSPKLPFEFVLALSCLIARWIMAH